MTLHLAALCFKFNRTEALSGGKLLTKYQTSSMWMTACRSLMKMIFHSRHPMRTGIFDMEEFVFVASRSVCHAQI